MGCFELSRENLRIFATRHKEIAVQPFKLAINLFVANDLFDLVNGSCMTLGSQAGTPLTVALYLADDQQGALHREETSLSLPADPSLRAQAVLRAVIARYTQKDSTHPLPAGADVNDVYIVNGTAVVDLNDALASGHRSGVMVEELTVLSLVQTLAANLPGITQVKILVNGQERDTLAGHADLADFYDVAAVNRAVGQMGGTSSP